MAHEREEQVGRVAVSLAIALLVVSLVSLAVSAGALAAWLIRALWGLL